MHKHIVLLGATGSIGTQTLDVARSHGIRIRALSAKKNIKLLAEQAREFCPEAVCIDDEADCAELERLLAGTGITVLTGIEGLCTLAAMECDCVVNAVVGMVGLRPTLAAIEAGNEVALANKETLVAGGELVMKAAERRGVKIIPIDSEHSAIFQCLAGNTGNKPRKLILTASGGPFFGYSPEMLKHVTRDEALKHPNWSMGRKITIDSATMMNKGLEFIEAMWLFGVEAYQIEIVIHRQSIVHSAVEFEDGAVMAQLGVPDMRVPIQYALTYPARLTSPAGRLSLIEAGQLTFEKPDYEAFKCLASALKAARHGGTAPAVVNCANEAAVAAFLENKLHFHQIGEIVEEALATIPTRSISSVSDILEAEKAAQTFVHKKVNT